MSGGRKSREWNVTYKLASASGTDLGMLHRMTTVAVAAVDLTKLPSLNGKLRKGDRRLGKRETADYLIVLFR